MTPRSGNDKEAGVSWIVDERELPGTDADHRNVLLSVGNGRHCTRGTPFEAGRDAWRGVYLSGLWTRGPLGLPYLMQGVYWPAARLLLAGREMDCVESRRRLDLARGVLQREAVFEAGGARGRLTAERLASLADAHVACQRLRVTLERSPGAVDLELGLDADVRSHRAKYYKDVSLRNIEGDFLRLTRVERLEAGDAYLNGRGVDEDFVKADALYWKACMVREENACRLLLKSYGNRFEQGLLPIGSRLGMMYYEGYGTDPDPDRARRIWREACEGGVQDACDFVEAEAELRAE